MAVNVNRAEFILSAASEESFLRDGLPQVAFAGRSNVGKSSAINRLLNRKNFARVGAVPGKTVHINYFKIDINDILIIHDDMDLEIGTFKIRYKGGSGGHNGLKNIEANLKTNEYKRIRIGISKNNIDMIDYVLGKFSDEELEKLNKVIKIMPDIINDFVTLSFENLMNKYN